MSDLYLQKTLGDWTMWAYKWADEKYYNQKCGETV